jgi:hypothetical protein
MRLLHLTDKTLLLEIKNLASNERSHTLQLLHHLKEIDSRKLYSDLKYSSLFDYCTRELGYSEGSAQRRIVACRMLRNLPELGPKIESGKLTLTNISQVKHFFKDKESQRKVLTKIEGISKKECEQKLFQISGKVLEAKETTKRVSENKTQIAIVLKDETLLLMEEIKNLLSTDLDSDQLIQFAFLAAKEKILKSKFKQSERKPSSPPLAKVDRYIQSHIKREVFKREKACVNCGGLHRLNYDHHKAFSLGGSSGIENIRMLCFNCNQRARLRGRL